MTKLQQDDDGGQWHWCPACYDMHRIAVDVPLANGAQWTFNGNHYRPTFKPSVSIKWGNTRVCHYHITDGQIKYVNDCSHDFKGKTVALPDIPEGELF